MVLDSNWFTEIAEDVGTAFSLRTLEKLHEETSDYQHIEIYQTETFGRLMVIDGCIMLTGRDNFIYHEMMTHPALFSHAESKHVAIIGGGDCGTLREVLKHTDVVSVTQVDIDERVTRLSERYFPELCAANADPRAKLIFADGIEWMTECEAESLDVIVVDSTDPVGPAEGLFNEPFYRSCHRALRPGGLLVQQSESPLAHTALIGAMHAAMHAADFADTHLLHFPQPVYPTGWWSATLACRDAGDLNEPPAQTDKVITDYYTPSIHRAALAQPAFIQRALKASSNQF